jgi:hypothetical protein
LVFVVGVFERLKFHKLVVMAQIQVVFDVADAVVVD